MRRLARLSPVAIGDLDDRFLPGAIPPLDLLIEHRGFAVFAADAFEQRWAGAHPHVDDGGVGESDVVSVEGHTGAAMGAR